VTVFFSFAEQIPQKSIANMNVAENFIVFFSFVISLVFSF